MPNLETPLADLCNICYANEPKYRCPRCKSRTCSLPCYKTHQQQASCNGHRDPAEYLKKSSLATPSGLDHDYNYLTSVERRLDDADRNVEERGIGIGFPETKFTRRRHNPQGAFQRYTAKNCITIRHAPKGMSRQVQNNTRISKNGYAVWTVEWADANGGRDVQGRFLESGTLSDHYAEFSARKVNAAAKRKKQETKTESPPSKRLKVEPATGEGSSLSQVGDARVKKQDIANHGDAALIREGDADEESERSFEKLSAYQPVEPDSESGADVDVIHIKEGGAGGVDEHTSEELSAYPLIEPVSDSEADIDEKQELSQHSSTYKQRGSSTDPESVFKTEPSMDLEQSSDGTKPGRYFYLLKPETTSASKVLIPVPGHATLTQALIGRTVMEFPTIFVLNYPEDALPKGFITEKQYSEVVKRENDELAEAEKMANGDSGFRAAVRHERQEKNPPAAAKKKVDPKDILAMLKRDITR